MNTPNTIRNKENERIENFLHILKTNPEAIEGQVLINEYKELLKIAFEEAKSNEYGAECLVSELLKLNIIDKNEIKEEYKELLENAVEKAKGDAIWARSVIPELLKLNIIDKSDKERYKELLENAVEKAKGDSNWARYVVPELIKLNIIEKSEIKEEFKELFEIVFEKAKHDSWWLESVIPELLKLNIIDKSDKERYKELLEDAMRRTKGDYYYKRYVVSELLKLNIIDKSDKERYKELLENAVEKAKGDSDWARYVVPELIKLNIIEKSDKERYKELLGDVMVEAGWSFRWARYVVPELIKLNIIEKSDKERYKELLEDAMRRTKGDYNCMRYVVPELLKLNIIDKSEIKEKYKKFLENVMRNAKQNSKWLDVFPELLKLNIIDKSDVQSIRYKIKRLLKLNDKSDVERYRELLGNAMQEVELDSNWARYVVPELLKLNIVDENEVKEKYKKYLENAMVEAEGNFDFARNVVLELLKLNIIDKNEIKEKYKKFLENVMENGKQNPEWLRTVVPELIKLNIIDKSDDERYRELLEDAMVEAGGNFDFARTVVPELLKLNIIDKNEIKEKYKKFLENVMENGKQNSEWLRTVFPELLKLNIIEKGDKERYKELLENAVEKAKSDSDWAIYVVPELLKLNIIDKSDKERYKELLEDAMRRTKGDYYYKRYVVSELLKLNIIDKSEINIDINFLQNITLVGTNFLEKNIDVIDGEDIMFINQIDDSFLGEEIDYLYKQDYDFFKEIEIAVKEKDYQKIWEVKKEFYPQEEKNKLQKMKEYFGEGVWTYFVDKVSGNKLLKNRFRDSHNALLREDDIIYLARRLEEKGVSKEYFLRNYLGIAGDRNNGYQQLYDFLDKYIPKWKELIEKELEDENGLKNDGEFIQHVNNLFEKERTGELYKNLDNLEQILTLLHMIRNKDSLIKLQRLANSDNPDDIKLYEYYKGAIYHPRTKPIIMKMYEDPEMFLGLDDTTFSSLERIHQAKKPSNMVENFEFLDFEAKDLVDCLPLGIYDQLSYFKPFEMKFYISGSGVYTKEELQQGIKALLNGNETKMSILCKTLHDNKKDIMWYQMWKKNQDTFVQTVFQEYGIKEFINLLGRFNFSELDKYKDLREMTAKISPKSDPNNRFNGFNCDSLSEGHGKKVVAMFNPYCTDFCIYEGDQDPKEDNLKVTSWVTLNRAIPENFTTLLNKVKSETTHDIANVLGNKFEDYKDPSEYVITMDNIEANPNFGRKNELAVRKMYEKFFSEYVRQNPMSPNGIPINTHKFYSGVNYNKLNILTDRVPNESLPVFVNAYSDNSASYSLQGNLDAGEQKEKEKKIGIHPLSIEDVVQISYMEGKIYPSSMKDHLGNLQHEITASILNNTLKGRPNLSFARYNEEGKIGGYILAYQGKMEDGTPGIYISDFAMDEKERGTAGVKMIHHWMDEVKKDYPDMPVFTRARENTSYRMIKAFAERKGYEIVEDEIMQDGGEKFHRVVMNPKNQ